MDVSIIIPVYNSSSYIKKCLDSILKETIKNLEVIVINDGSEDDSLKIIKSYNDKIENLVVIDKINEGPAKARNQALTIAKGEYVFYMDSDDWLEEKSLTKLHEEAKSSNADISIGKVKKCYEDGREEIVSTLFNDVDSKRKYLLNETGCWGKLIKRDLIIKYSLYFLENHIFEDIATVPAYMLHTDNIIYSDTVVYNYNIRTGSSIRTKEYTTDLEDIYDSMYNVKMLFENAGKDKEYKDELEFLYINHLLHDASIRFFKYDKYKRNILKIAGTMDEVYPEWKENKYFKQMDKKYRKICNAFYNKKYLYLKLVLKK